ncbi:MAG: flippase-like domain-containing protein [Candidatus Diapherotrites archaeon]|nr:flippase-like domain-containing protein [Candidatus Diapherotrites archaeon]
MKKLLALIGIALFAFILLSIDLNEMLTFLSKADLTLIALAILILVSTIAVRCAKWFLILKKQGIELSFWKAFKYYYIGIVLGTFTPGRLGDFAKALYLKEHGLAKVFACVLVDRLADISVLFLTGLLASVLFSLYFSIEVFSSAMVMLLIVLFCLAAYIFLNEPLLKKLLKPFYNHLVPARFKTQLRQGFGSFIKTSHSIVKSKKLILAVLVISFISWALLIYASYLIALALSLNVSLSFLFLVIPVTTLVMLIPISISGIGTRDATTIILFSLVGIAAEQAFAFSLLFFALSLIVAALGIPLFMSEKLDLSIA